MRGAHELSLLSLSEPVICQVLIGDCRGYTPYTSWVEPDLISFIHLIPMAHIVKVVYKPDTQSTDEYIVMVNPETVSGRTWIL
jgi:uncharacterized membrane protein YhdT